MNARLHTIFRRYAMLSLPALGLLVTALLILLVHGCLLSGVKMEKADFEALRVRSPMEKKDTKEKAEEPPKFGAIGTRPAVEFGTVREVIDARLKKPADKPPEPSAILDVRTRQLNYLTTWSAINLLQGALALVVLVLAGRIIWWHWRELPSRKAYCLPGAIAVVSVALVFVGDWKGFAPFSMRGSVNEQLQNEARKAFGSDFAINSLTMVGNLGITAVVVTVALGLGMLLDSLAERPVRLLQFRQLMRWTGVLLVVGVIQVTYQNRMPALFFDDEFNIQHIGQMASGTGLVIGGVFSVAMGLVFLPVGHFLGDPAASADEPSTRGGLAEILAVLAPVLTALPIGKLFDLAS